MRHFGPQNNGYFKLPRHTDTRLVLPIFIHGRLLLLVPTSSANLVLQYITKIGRLMVCEVYDLNALILHTP